MMMSFNPYWARPLGNDILSTKVFDSLTRVSDRVVSQAGLFGSVLGSGLNLTKFRA